MTSLSSSLWFGTKIGLHYRTIIIEIWSETPSNKQKYSSDEIEAAHNQIFMVIFEKTNHSRQNSMNGRQMCFYCCVRIFFIIALCKHVAKHDAFFTKEWNEYQVWNMLKARTALWRNDVINTLKWSLVTSFRQKTM